MTDTSVDATAPPGQGLLGEFIPAKGARLTLHRRDSGIILLRHRVNTYENAADIAARINGADIKWDDWHRKHRPVWMPTVEDWIRETTRTSS